MWFRIIRESLEGEQNRTNLMSNQRYDYQDKKFQWYGMTVLWCFMAFHSQLYENTLLRFVFLMIIDCITIILQCCCYRFLMMGNMILFVCLSILLKSIDGPPIRAILFKTKIETNELIPEIWWLATVIYYIYVQKDKIIMWT
jgi:hypothetical protein